MGANGQGKILVVVHTYAEDADGGVMIRIISARAPTRRETRDYEQGS
jgi:uncharacterized DUF497 family protein